MALLNLAVNARDAMPDGGQLRIGVTCDSMAADNRLRLREGRYVRLSVADTGIGMDQQPAEQAIETFFTTKGVGKGTGLGLSMDIGSGSCRERVVMAVLSSVVAVYSETIIS